MFDKNSETIKHHLLFHGSWSIHFIIQCCSKGNISGGGGGGATSGVWGHAPPEKFEI